MPHTVLGTEDSGMNDNDKVSGIMEPRTFQGSYYH